MDKETQEQIWKEYKNWLIKNNKSITGLTDVLINENGTIKVEKHFATVINISSDDFIDFCKETGRNVEATRLIAMY